MKYLFSFWGKVRHGKNRGKRLGFPTANIRLNRKIPEGIYISETKMDGKIFPSLTFVGRAKTFNENIYQGENYIFDFNKSLYNQWLSVRLIKKIRENQKFNSEEELIRQMKKDKKVTEKYFRISNS